MAGGMRLTVTEPHLARLSSSLNNEVPMRWSLVSVALFVLSGCWQDAKNIAGGDPNASTVSLPVTYKNLDTPVIGENIHLFGPNEDFSPSNRLAPGDFRSTRIPMRRNEEALITAGRNGSVITTKKCKCTSACPETGFTPVGSARVEWNGSAISCVAW